MSWNYATFPPLLSRIWKIHIEKMIEIKSLNFKIWENFSFILLSSQNIPTKLSNFQVTRWLMQDLFWKVEFNVWGGNITSV